MTLPPIGSFANLKAEVGKGPPPTPCHGEAGARNQCLSLAGTCGRSQLGIRPLLCLAPLAVTGARKKQFGATLPPWPPKIRGTFYVLFGAFQNPTQGCR